MNYCRLDAARYALTVVIRPSRPYEFEIEAQRKAQDNPPARTARQFMEMTHEKTSSSPRKAFEQTWPVHQRRYKDCYAVAEQRRTVYLSRSSAGTGSTLTTIVCFVTCPNDVVLEMQYAIDQAVGDLLAEHGSKPVRVQ